MATSVQVVFDCINPECLAHFWAAALHYKLQDPPEGFATWDEALAAWGIPDDQRNSASAIVDPEGKGPRIYFQQTPTPKTVKNRVHLDLNVGGGPGTPPEEHQALIEREAERLIALGASKVREGDERGHTWFVMRDPEGNEFCIQ